MSKLTKNIGMLLLAVWLILYGVLTAPFLGVSFAHSGDILAVLAIVAGVLLLVQREDKLRAETVGLAMKTILETDRLLLREFVAGDAEVYFRMVSDLDVTRYTGDGGKTPGEVTRMMEERLFADYRLRGYGRWAAVYKPTGAVIGFAGLKYLEDVDEVDLGYRFFKEHWGRGLATEAARAVLAHGFGTLGLRRVIGIADVGNKASIRVLEKVGFAFEKHTTYRGHEVAWYVVGQ